MTKFRIGSIAILICVLFSVASLNTLATDYYWNVAAGDWSVDTNWDPSGPPSDNGDVYIENGGTAVIDTDVASGSVRNVRIYNGSISQSANNAEIENLRVGFEGNSGYCSLNGGTLSVANDIFLGYSNTSEAGTSGNGYFDVSGGTLNVGVGDNPHTVGLVVGYGHDAYSEINISTGIVNVLKDFIIGYDTAMGNAVVNQTAGELFVNEHMMISFRARNAFNPREGHGVYVMSGGIINVVESLHIGSMDMVSANSYYRFAEYDPSLSSDGRLLFTGGYITVNQNLNIFHADSYISDSGAPASGGGTIEIWNDFLNYSYACWDFDMRHTTVILHGGAGFDEATCGWDFSILDMNSADFGATVAGLDANFAIGNLVFSGAEGTSVWYQLESDIYCYGLSIEEGARIDLNGFNIYYMPQGCGAYSGVTGSTFQLGGIWGNMNGGDGDVIAIGDAPPVPEPGTIMLIGAGVLALAGVARRRFA